MLELANAWQRGFPLTPRPFRDIAERESLPEGEVLEKFAALKSQGVIDRIGPVFRPNTVGSSTLAAMAVPPARLAAVAALVSAQPGVNHNYEREHDVNLWFVVTAPAARDVQRIVSRIEKATAIEVLRLPLVEEHHIDLGFDLGCGGAAVAAPRAAPPRACPPLSDAERRVVAAVAGGLPLVAAPYAAIARELGVAEDDVVSSLGRMLADGRIRRIGAVVRHRRVGYDANAMAVWDVPDAAAPQLGRLLAQQPAVTLCYRRARCLPRWPYNLYCMVHGRERQRVAGAVQRISAACGLDAFPRAVLFSQRCFSQGAARYG